LEHCFWPCLHQQKEEREAAEEASAPQTVNASLSNGSSQSKQTKRNVRSTYLRDSVAEAPSPINSQGAVTSSSPDEVENGLSTVHVESRSKDGEAATADTAGPEHHESKFEHIESTTRILVFLLFRGTRTYGGRTSRISIREMCMLWPPFPGYLLHYL